MVERVAIPEAERRGGTAEDLIDAFSRGPQVADPGISVRLRQLCAVVARDQGMVKEAPRAFAPEQSAHLDLSARGSEEILSADHQIDALVEVIHHRRELVGPLAETITHENIAALVGRGLLECTEPEIFEGHGPGLETDAARRLKPAVHQSITAGSRVAPFSGHRARTGLQRLPRAGAGVNEAVCFQRPQSLFVSRPAFPLRREDVIRNETKPGQILEDPRFELGSGTRLVVVLDPQAHPTTEGAGHAPDRDRVRHVTEVEKPRGGGGEAREKTRGRSRAQELPAQRFTAMPTTSKRAPKRRAPEPMKARAGNSLLK